MNRHLTKLLTLLAVFGLLSSAAPSIAERCAGWDQEGQRYIYGCSMAFCNSDPTKMETNIYECNSWCCPGGFSGVQYDQNSCQSAGVASGCCIPGSQPWVNGNCPPPIPDDPEDPEV